MRYQDVIENFIAGKSAKSGNYESDGKSLFLFGKRIAERVVESSQVNFVVTVADYGSNTTVKALNCLPGIRVHTSKGQLYLNNMAWDGEKTSVRALEVKTGEEVTATAKRLLTQEQFDDLFVWLLKG